MRPSRILLTLGISAGTLADSSSKIIPEECADLLFRTDRYGNGTSEDYRIVHQCCIGYDAPCPHAGNSDHPPGNSNNPPGHPRKRDYHGILPESCVNPCSVALDSIDGTSSETSNDLIEECFLCLRGPQDYTPTTAKSLDSVPTTLISPPLNARDVYGPPDPNHSAIPIACKGKCSRSPDDGPLFNELEGCLQCVVEQAQQASKDSGQLGARDHGNKSPMPCRTECTWIPHESPIETGDRCLNCLVASGAFPNAPGVVATPRHSVPVNTEYAFSYTTVIASEPSHTHHHHHHGKHSSEISVLTHVTAPVHSYPTSVLDCPGGAENCVLGNARFTKSAMPSVSEVDASVWKSVGMDHGRHWMWDKTQEDGDPYTKAKRQDPWPLPTYTVTVIENDPGESTLNTPSATWSEDIATLLLRPDGTNADGSTLYEVMPDFFATDTATSAWPNATTSSANNTGSGTAISTLPWVSSNHLETVALTASDGRSTVITRADLGSTYVTLSPSTDATGSLHLVSNAPFTWPALPSTSSTSTSSDTLLTWPAPPSTWPAPSSTPSSSTSSDTLLTWPALQSSSSWPTTLPESTVTLRQSEISFLPGVTEHEVSISVQAPETIHDILSTVREISILTVIAQPSSELQWTETPASGYTTSFEYNVSGTGISVSTLEPVIEHAVTETRTSILPTSWTTAEPDVEETVTLLRTSTHPTSWATSEPVATQTVTKTSVIATYTSRTTITISPEPIIEHTVTATSLPFDIPATYLSHEQKGRRSEHLPECFNDQLRFDAGYLGEQEPLLGQVMWPWPLPPFQHWMQPGGHLANASDATSPLWPRIWGGIEDHELGVSTDLEQCSKLPIKTEYSTVFDAPMSGASWDYDRTTTVGAVEFAGRTINLPASVTRSLSHLYAVPTFDKTKTVTMIKDDNTVYTIKKSKGKYGTHSYSVRPTYDATKTITGFTDRDGHTHFPGHHNHHVVHRTKFSEVNNPHCTKVVEVMGLGICGGTEYNVFLNTITRPPISASPTTCPGGLFAAKTDRICSYHDQCMYSYIKPINYTTVRSVMMPDPYEEGNYVYANASFVTSMTRPHWGFSKTKGVYWPTTLHSSYHDGAWTTEAKFLMAAGVETTSRLALADDPKCYDYESCHQRCHDWAKRNLLWQTLLWALVPILIAALILAAILSLCLPRFRARRHNRVDEKHNTVTETVVTTHNPNTGAATSTLVTAAVVGGAAGAAGANHGGQSGAQSGGQAGGASGSAGAGTATAAGAGAGAAAGGDGRGTQRRAAEEGRQPKGVRFDEKSGSATAPAPAHPAHVDGAAERTGSEVFDVGSMRGRKRNRGEEGGM